MTTRQAQSRSAYGGSSLALENDPRFLPAGGTSGQVLSVSVTGTPVWAAPTSGGSGSGSSTADVMVLMGAY